MIRLGHRVSPADHRSDFSFSSSTSSTAFCAMEYERDDAARNRVMALLMQRDEMETEMEAIVSSLTKSGGPGLSGNLVDAEGFPRADIDIPAIRGQRQRLAILRTDYKVLTSIIETFLLIALSPGESGVDIAINGTDVATSQETNVNEVVDMTQPTDIQNRPVTRPAFAFVDEVFPDSPACTAGLKTGDRLIAVGAVSLHSMPTMDLAVLALPSLVREHENQEIDILVSRAVAENDSCERELVNIKLTPRRWSGRGLLGCYVVRAPAEEDTFVPLVATVAANRAQNLS